MASELVPGNFLPVEVDASFRRFLRGSHTRFGAFGELLIHKKKQTKKKTTFIRAKDSSADFTN